MFLAASSVVEGFRRSICVSTLASLLNHPIQVNPIDESISTQGPIRCHSFTPPALQSVVIHLLMMQLF